MSTALYWTAAVGMSLSALALISHAMTSREDRWRDAQLRRGRDPRDIDDEAAVRKALVELRNDCSQAVMDGRDWQRELELCLMAKSETLERRRPKLGRKFIALVEQMDNDDILDPPAYAKAFPRTAVNPILKLTPQEIKEITAHERRISDAAFPDA